MLLMLNAHEQHANEPTPIAQEIPNVKETLTGLQGYSKLDYQALLSKALLLEALKGTAREYTSAVRH